MNNLTAAQLNYDSLEPNYRVEEEAFWEELANDKEAVERLAADFVEDGSQPNLRYGPRLTLHFDELVEMADAKDEKFSATALMYVISEAALKGQKAGHASRKLSGLLVEQAEKLIIEHCNKQLGAE
jgi:hypothetical protein